MGRKSNDFTLVEYTEDELKELRDKALLQYDDIIEMWASELKYTLDEKGFDEYSRSGEKKIKNLTKKYADMLSDTEITLRMIYEELSKYEEYNEQQRYIQGGNYKEEEIDEDEFLRREKEKTDRIRQIINNNDF